LGSLPFGLIIARLAKGIDIRQHGSGNIGATNVFRVAGKGWGVLVFILDFAKGLVAILLAKAYLPYVSWAGINILSHTPFSGDLGGDAFVFCSIAVVCGHNWPVFLKFKGGKGVATTVGALVGLSFIFKPLLPIIGLTLLTWGVVFAVSRFVSLGSILAATVFLVLVLVSSSLPVSLKVLSAILFAFILLRHKSNIERLLSKQEHRF
jgi:glycerol-3-phosphate acyltransferase PlsY